MAYLERGEELTESEATEVTEFDVPELDGEAAATGLGDGGAYRYAFVDIVDGPFYVRIMAFDNPDTDPAGLEEHAGAPRGRSARGARPVSAARELDGAVGDDVLLHLGGAGADRGVALPRVVVGGVAAVDGVGAALGEEPERAEQVDVELGERLRQVAPLELGDRRLGPDRSPLSTFDSARALSRRVSSIWVYMRAMRSRMSGSSSASGLCSRAAAIICVELGPQADGDAAGADPLVGERAHGDVPAVALARRAGTRRARGRR